MMKLIVDFRSFAKAPKSKYMAYGIILNVNGPTAVFRNNDFARKRQLKRKYCCSCHAERA